MARASKRTAYAEEIKRRIQALELPGIGSNVFIHQANRPGQAQVQPCIEIKRGPRVDQSTELCTGFKFESYHFQVMAKLKDGLQGEKLDKTDKYDDWYESIRDEFHAKDWVDGFPEVWECLVIPGEQLKQQTEEYQLATNGLVIQVSFHIDRA